MDGSKKGFRLTNVQIFPPLTQLQKYRLYYTCVLSSVPLGCGLMVIALLNMFAKLNLYFLESNGLILDEQIRDAYFSQVQIELSNVIWYLGVQIVAASIASYVIVRWSSAPFIAAQKMIRTAIDRPEDLKPNLRWFSESPTFDRTIWQLALQIKSRTSSTFDNEDIPAPDKFNPAYFIKFTIAFIALSISMGHVTGIFIVTIYEKIVSLALQLVPSTQGTTHFYLAQQEMLLDAVNVAIAISILAYMIIGTQISRYMSNMIYVFTRSIREQKLPMFLRKPEIYHGLADTINEGSKLFKK